MITNKQHALDIIITASAPVIWGSTYLITTEFLPPNRPFLAAVLRCLPAGLLLLLWTRQFPKQQEWVKLIILAVLNIGLFQAMLFISAYRLAGGLAAILSSTQVLMVLMLVAFVGKQSVHKLTWLCAGLGVIGVTLLILTPQANADVIGIISALLGAMSMAMGIFFAKRWVLSLDTLALTGWQLFIGGLVLVPITLMFEQPPNQLTLTNITAYLYLCLIGAVLAYVLYFWGVVRLAPAVVSSLGLLSPICAFVLGWLFLGQNMTGVAVVGFVLVLMSIVGVQYTNK